MPLFQKKAIAPEPPAGGGLNALRDRARAHARNPAAHALLKEALSVSGAELDVFLNGGLLAPPKIPLLIAYLDLRAEYLPDLDLLRSTMPEPVSMGIAPAPYVPPATADAPRTEPLLLKEPVPPGMLKPASLHKPGWA